MLPNVDAKLGTPDKQIAMTCALGEIAARRYKKGKGKERSEVGYKLFRSLSHVCDGVGEYSATGIQTFLDAGGNLTVIAKVARDYRSDPELGPLLDHIKDALLGGA
jgi:predicted transcriptional regulator